VKIAFFHNHPSGGAARALHELGRQLSRRHEVNVYTLTTGDEEFLRSSDYATRVRVFDYEQRPPIRLGLYLNEWRRYRDLGVMEEISRHVAAAIDGETHDVVLVNACRFLLAPSVLAYLTSPCAYYCHEPPRRFLQDECRPDAGPLTAYQRLRSWWHRPGRAVLDSVMARRDRRNVAAADVVLTNSEFTSEVVSGYYGRSFRVCRLGVNPDRFRPNGGARGDYVLSVGELQHHKGFDFLIRALAELPRRTRPELVIFANYGNPAVADHLEGLAARHGVTLRLRAGPEDELVRAYQGARAFVYGSHKEPFGLVVLEAMACGLPVVAVEEGGVPEIVLPEVNGLLCPRDEQIFAETLSRVLGDSHLADSMVREGRRLAETEWTWEAAAERVEAQLSSVARRTPEVVR
jgi:glycosyltransferase involved in cell wall biosynthesis